jgi:hypothetical protein
MFFDIHRRIKRIANMLNCLLGNLPMKYLGIPITDHHLSIAAFSSIFDKMIRDLTHRRVSS